MRRLLNFSLALIALWSRCPASIHCVGGQAWFAGPVLYRQQRVGRRGKVFYCYKFRTMRQDAEADTGATWASDDDRELRRWENFCGPRGSMRFRSCGAC